MSIHSGVGLPTGNPFRDYCSRVLEDLCREHDREVAAMYNDNLNIRKELSRVAELLASSVEREKELHRVSDILQSVFHQSISQIGQNSAAAQHASNQHGGNKARLLDPLQATQQELARIQQILSHPPVPPPSFSSMSSSTYNALPAPALPAVTNGAIGMPVAFETAAYAAPPVMTSSYVASPVQSYVTSPVQSYVPPTVATTTAATTCTCGNVFMDDAAFCRKCGRKRGSAVAMVASPVAMPAYTAAFAHY